jgi:hypothetical protein
MVWLALASALPDGAWRRKIGITGESKLCHTGELEISVHLFLTCRHLTAHTWPQKLLFKLTDTAKKDKPEKFFLDSSIYTLTKTQDLIVCLFQISYWSSEHI